MPDPTFSPRRWPRLLKKAAKIGIATIGALLLFVLVVLALTGLLSTDRIEIPLNHQGQYLSVKGEKVRYYQTGAGPDILLIHGLPGLLEDWKPILSAAATKYRLTAYDRPGHGYSAAPGQYSLSHNADVALGLIDELQLKHVIVVGHSYGGVVALAMAVRNPPQVKGFILLGAMVPQLQEPSDSNAHTKARKGNLNLLDLVRFPVLGRGFAKMASLMVGNSMVRAGMARAFSPNETFLTREIIDERLSVFTQTKVIVALANEGAGFNDDFAPLETQLADIRKPLDFIHGENDRFVPVAQVERFHARFPSTGLTILQDTGHEVQFVHPEAVLSAIDALSTR